MKQLERPPEAFFEGTPKAIVDYIHGLQDLVDDLLVPLLQLQQDNEQLRAAQLKLENRIVEQDQLIAQQQQRIEELEGRSPTTSSNSSLPPSVEHPHAKTKPAKKASGKKQGGQKGHPGHQRKLVPVEECSQVIPCIPTQCSCCKQPLTGKIQNRFGIRFGNCRRSSPSSPNINSIA